MSSGEVLGERHATTLGPVAMLDGAACLGVSYVFAAALRGGLELDELLATLGFPGELADAVRQAASAVHGAGEEWRLADRLAFPHAFRAETSGAGGEVLLRERCLVSTKAAADRLGVSTRRVRQLIGSRQLPATRGQHGYLIDAETLAVLERSRAA